MRAAIFNILSERIARNLRRDYMTSVLGKDIEFYDERRTGELSKLPISIVANCSYCFTIVSRLNSDIMVVQESLSNNFSMFTRAMIQFIVEIIIMLIIEVELTGITCAGVVPLGIFTVFY